MVVFCFLGFGVFFVSLFGMTVLVEIPLVGMTWGSLVVENFGFRCLAKQCLFITFW